MINQVMHRGEVLAIYVRSAAWKAGLHFVSSDKDFIQVGLWGYDTGRKLGPHKHVPREREVRITQEMIFVKRGSLRAFLFSPDLELIEEIDLHEGDLLILFSGGHGYKILEEGTQVLEVKNGPYMGLEDRLGFEHGALSSIKGSD